MAYENHVHSGGEYPLRSRPFVKAVLMQAIVTMAPSGFHQPCESAGSMILLPFGMWDFGRQVAGGAAVLIACIGPWRRWRRCAAIPRHPLNYSD